MTDPCEIREVVPNANEWECKHAIGHFTLQSLCNMVTRSHNPIVSSSIQFNPFRITVLKWFLSFFKSDMADKNHWASQKYNTALLIGNHLTEQRANSSKWHYPAIYSLSWDRLMLTDKLLQIIAGIHIYLHSSGFTAQICLTNQGRRKVGLFLCYHRQFAVHASGFECSVVLRVPTVCLLLCTPVSSLWGLNL